MQISGCPSIALQDDNLCAFSTLPITPFSAPTTGRYATLKGLRVDKVVVYLMLNGVFDQRPDLDQDVALQSLLAKGLGSNSRPAILSTPPDWDINLPDFTLLGSVEVMPDESVLIPRFVFFGTWGGASSHVEDKWRWRHDRKAYQRKITLDREAQEDARQAEQIRYENHLKYLIWETLLAETMFMRWSPSPPFPPEEFTNAVRAKFRDAVLELRAMVPKPNKGEARRVLVRWLTRSIYSTARTDTSSRPRNTKICVRRLFIWPSYLVTERSWMKSTTSGHGGRTRLGA